MNGYYNRPLTLTDFLYLSVFFIGMCKIYQIGEILVFLPFITVSCSILLDWNSAITIANGGMKLLISDLITVLNYLCLYMTFEHINLKSADTIVMFFVHYSIIFLIYFIWNILVVIGGKTTKKTKIFFGSYSFIAIVCFVMCITFIIYIAIMGENIQNEWCNIVIIIISAIHIITLTTWVIWTYFIKTNEKHKE